jgi:putative redox protein
MVNVDITYDGNKKCTVVHESGTAISTEAPKDMNGEGNVFSPTDLFAAGLGSCIVTTMAVFAKRHDIELAGVKAHVTKEMSATPPRRIARLASTVTIPAGLVPNELRSAVEAAGRACPAHKSLHPEIDAPIEYVWL